MDHRESHICGGLPVTTVGAWVVHCHHHQAWSVMVQTIRQDADEPSVLAHVSYELGPFDGADELVHSLVRTLSAQLRALPELP